MTLEAIYKVILGQYKKGALIILYQRISNIKLTMKNYNSLYDYKHNPQFFLLAIFIKFINQDIV